MAPCRGDGPERALVLVHESTSPKDPGERDRFLAVLAHELSTPVNNLSAAAELLARRLEADDSPSLRLLQVIRAEANHLRWLFTQFPATLPVGDRVPQPQKHLIPLRPLLRQTAQTFYARCVDPAEPVDRGLGVGVRRREV
ncbi:MAG: histidine kinase dimerization/phospho-acceptor domain-containing protein [Anaerolineae bacterium]